MIEFIKKSQEITIASYFKNYLNVENLFFLFNIYLSKIFKNNCD